MKKQLTRRDFISYATRTGAGIGVLVIGLERVADATGTDISLAAEALQDYWWYRYPSFVQSDTVDLFKQCQARMVIHGAAKDPTWGPFAQRTSLLEEQASLKAIKALGGRAITWIEGFGDCMLYTVALQRNPDGTFKPRTDDPKLATVIRSHWNWADPKLPKGNTLRWVGQHNLVNREDFVLPLIEQIKALPPIPTYPDGRPAVELLPDVRYPLNAMVYDACGSKDINGDLFANLEATVAANKIDPATGKPTGPLEGLYPAILGKDDVAAVPGSKPGDTIYCGVISVHKDLSAPYWREYVRLSIREIVRAGLDGVWCDNYSPWDNFGYPPVQKAFGDWSVAKFHTYIKSPLGRDRLGKEIANFDKFDVRTYLKAKATEFGATAPSKHDDKAWRDARWLDEPIWNAYKAFRQKSAQEDLAAFYKAIHEQATKEGRPDFCIGGNDVPLYGLGWVRDTWQDMINTETTPGWHMGSGSRGIMIPPLGKMAVLYRLALEHQKGPFSAAWYYLNGPYEKYQQKPEIGKVLVSEAFANGAFLLCMSDNKQVAGTVESHTWWNRFVHDNEAQFGNRIPAMDVGVLYSPDNQLALMTPGGYPNLDDQPHVFGHHGWATALIDAHIPYRSITDWKLTEVELRPLKTLILPHAICMDLPSIAAIKAWVEAGGRLVVTGFTATRSGPDEWFTQLRVGNALTSRLALPDVEVNGSEQVDNTTVGKGSVGWIGPNVGMEYYLKHEKRKELLPPLVKLIGQSGIVQASGLPSTVGLSLWRSSDGSALFTDLVNYNLNADADTVTPSGPIRFRVKIPETWKTIKAMTLTPDAIEPATAARDGSWAVISVPDVVHFSSVKLTE